MSVRVLLIPVLVWAFLFGGGPDARERESCDPPTQQCSDCRPVDGDGRIEEPAPCGFRCCCAPDRAPDPSPTRAPVRADGPRIVLGMPMPAERAAFPTLLGVVPRSEPALIPVRPSGRVLLAFHCVWQT